ncbi:MAG: formimidoylglutamate deiminase [Acidimicrobiales bacterium]
MTDSYWCEHAVVNGALRHAVSIAVVDGRFTSITSGTAPAPGARRLDGLTIPGFANAHSHAFHRALRSRTQADRGSFWTWREVMYEAAGTLDPGRYHGLARAVFAEMASAGISCVGEFHYLHHQPDGTPYDDPNAMSEALLVAAREAGIRITLLETLYLHGGLGPNGYTAPTGAQIRYSDRTAEAWVKRVENISTTDSSRVGAAIHSVRAVNPSAMKIVADWAGGNDAPIHAHVSEQVAENEQCQIHHGSSPVELLERSGVLGPNFTAVHATHLTPSDIDLLADTGSAVCMCPTTERDLGDGIGPSVELAAAGVAINLGSDSHAVIDHSEEMRAVELDERLSSQQRGLHAAADLLHMATTAGHTALGWADAGAIAPGNRADLTTIDLGSIRTAGASTDLALEAAVFAATSSDVASVIVDGRVVVDDHTHVSLDVDRELTTSIEELFS